MMVNVIDISHWTLLLLKEFKKKNMAEEELSLSACYKLFAFIVRVAESLIVRGESSFLL